MDDQMTINPWLPDFLQQGLRYAMWLEMLQYVLLIVLGMAVLTMVCALLDLVLLFRQECQQTQPLSISVLKIMTRWLDTHITHGPLWRAVVAGTHSAGNALQHVRHWRFPH